MPGTCTCIRAGARALEEASTRRAVEGKEGGKREGQRAGKGWGKEWGQRWGKREGKGEKKGEGKREEERKFRGITNLDVAFEVKGLGLRLSG
jgi:hypothetical protein